MAGYLKALGVFRLLAEQAKQEVKGCWEAGVFVLDTNMSKNDIHSFFLNDYAPTPIVSPWNGGSGFYQGDNMVGIKAVLNSGDVRFDPYRQVIMDIRSWPEMPKSYERIKEITIALKDLIDKSSLGKKRNDLEKLLNNICTNLEPNNQVSGLQISEEFSLIELEENSRNTNGERKKAYKSLWSAVKKGRTECVRSERGENKDSLLSICRSRLPEKFLSWFDAAIALKSDGSPSYNGILGTGGNDGNLDLSNNFMLRLAELLINNEPGPAGEFLEASLFSIPASNLVKASVGQFDPGRAGGFNQGAAVESKNFKINPWDFVLMLEGATLFSGSVSRHKQADAAGQAALPFMVGLSGVGYPSSNIDEEGRAEAWLPTWTNPAGYPEIRHLFGEARSSVGRRASQTGLDFARSLSTLGVDRGLDGFVRFALLKRRGDSFIALPAGSLPVHYQPDVRLLDDLDPIIRKIDGFLRGVENPPAGLKSARRQLYEAMFACSQQPDPSRFSNLVRALGRFESLIAQQDHSKQTSLARPLSGLRPVWIQKCDDGGIEVRLAAALASIGAGCGVGPIRSNMSGVAPQKPWKWAVGAGQKHWYGPGLTERLAGVLNRRFLDMKKTGTNRLPLEAELPLNPDDLVSFLRRETDDRKIEELLWGFLMIDWKKKEGLKSIRDNRRKTNEAGPLPRSYILLKLLFTPDPVGGKHPRPEPRIIALLKAGRTDEACRVARRRLRTVDLKPTEVEYETDIDPKRLLAGLLVPVQPFENELLRLVLQPHSK